MMKERNLERVILDADVVLSLMKRGGTAKNFTKIVCGAIFRKTNTKGVMNFSRVKNTLAFTGLIRFVPNRHRRLMVNPSLGQQEQLEHQIFIKVQQNASVHHFLEDQGGTVSQNTKDTTGAIWRKTNTKGVLTPPNQRDDGGIG